MEGIQYELVRKKVKQLHLRVRSNGTVMVSIPLKMCIRDSSLHIIESTQCFV